MMEFNISILGGGSWGSALAKTFSARCNNIVLYNRNNMSYSIAENVSYTNDFNVALANKIIFIAVPAQEVRNIFDQIKKLITDHFIIICAKGIEKNTFKFMSEVAAEFIDKNQIAVLSGPNLADEIVQNLPSVTVFASENIEYSNYVIENLSSSKFHIYFSEDIISVEIGGAIKNIIAIACGIASSMNLGENFRAILITAGLYEMHILASYLETKSINLMGPAGIGDLILTASSNKSRNFRFGYSFRDNPEQNKDVTIEGVHTAISVKNLADKYNLNMPICNFIYNCIIGNEKPEEIVNLFDRFEFMS